MSRRRRRIVGAQAAAVALLVIVVYATLLRPLGPSALRGIEAPGGETTTQVPPDREPERDPDLGPGEGPRPPQGGQSRPRGGAGPRGSGATALVINHTPTDDQYRDSVKALLTKLAPGGAVGD